MAHILYGVCGQGSGHSTRAKEIILHLIKQGHSVDIVSYDAGYRNLSVYFPVSKIYGPGFVYERNQVKYIATGLKNMASLPDVARSLDTIFSIIFTKKIDLVITDFEPLSALAASVKRLPIISIDNQHRLIKGRISYPKKYSRAAMAAKLVTTFIIPPCDAYLVTTFFDGTPTDKHSYFFPPIVREEVRRSTPTNGKNFLVYTTSPSNDLPRLLQKVRNASFIFYGNNVDKKMGNVTCKKHSHKEFLHDLVHCAGIIGNAGFSLMSEALFLGKPYLAWPVAKQFEQIISAYYIDKLGYGRYYDSLSAHKIEQFIHDLPKFRAILKKYPREDNSKLFARLDALIAQFTE